LHKEQDASALLSSPNVNFLSDGRGIIYLDAQVFDGTFDFRMTKQELNRS
jgi:hypothetical protein